MTRVRPIAKLRDTLTKGKYLESVQLAQEHSLLHIQLALHKGPTVHAMLADARERLLHSYCEKIERAHKPTIREHQSVCYGCSWPLTSQVGEANFRLNAVALSN